MLLDTNVVIYAFDPESPFFDWARNCMAKAVSGEGAFLNAISLAEICVGDESPATVAERIRSWGVGIVDVPAAAAELCARAYSVHRSRRKAATGMEPPAVPLPDFFIGAHAQILNWPLATADEGRFRTYFPKVRLLTP